MYYEEIKSVADHSEGNQACAMIACLKQRTCSLLLSLSDHLKSWSKP
jgi:hypothetical protein